MIQFETLGRNSRDKLFNNLIQVEFALTNWSSTKLLYSLDNLKSQQQYVDDSKEISMTRHDTIPRGCDKISWSRAMIRNLNATVSRTRVGCNKISWVSNDYTKLEHQRGANAKLGRKSIRLCNNTSRGYRKEISHERLPRFQRTIPWPETFDRGRVSGELASRISTEIICLR